ncbi:MAG TPA: DUF3137 domain-containing protein [Phycisphaerales bacterium]|nr:DUF3137 domain-containing protein [Phycisphaerales bacterium]
MKTLDEFRAFYEGELMKDLRALEARRAGICRNLLILFVALALIVLVIGVALGMAGGPAAVFVPAVLSVVIGSLAAAFMTKGYKRDFKLRIIERIIRFVEPQLNYKPTGYIDRETFMMSRIFTTRPNRYKGDDLVSGTVGRTDMKFCELNAVHESGSGKNKHRVTIFKGLFFVADFHKDFRTKTVVLPDTAEKLFGRLGQKLQAMNVFRGSLIKLEDPEFERHFAVYGDDQIESRYILSPGLMERIVQFKVKTDRKIYLSFVASSVFVAVSYTRNLFEPRLFRTLLDFTPMQQYFEDVQLAVGIVDDLNLNTRIWSKE